MKIGSKNELKDLFDSSSLKKADEEKDRMKINRRIMFVFFPYNWYNV
jgi:hypothetical protein